ncbi:hypothetical protein [Lactiplantibacillus paraxiangfangensis]|uniref:hypothetical protein n=1 Tax=Lactiplantibacillus paraxiangfangensis TaxID=3076224 RepID=UPI0030C6F39E
MMTKKHFSWTLSNSFAALLLVVGAIVALWALITNFGTTVSVDAVVTAAGLWIVGLIFLHPAPINILIPVIIFVSVGAGYAGYFSSPHSWLGAAVATLLTALIVSYGFSLRKTIRQRHSNWYQK